MQLQKNITVVELMGTGGMIHYAYQLCSALAKQGTKVTLITSKDYELDSLPHHFKVVKLLHLWPHHQEINNQLQPQNFKRLLRRFRRGLRLIITWFQLTTFLLNSRPDVVQFGKINFWFEGFFLRFLRWRGLYLSQICHEYELRESSKFLTALSHHLDRFIYHSFEDIFVHGMWNKERFCALHQFPPAHVFSIEHGNEAIFHQLAQPDLDLTARYDLLPQQPVVLFFGNLMPSKGVPDLVEAFTMVRQECPEARLLIAGYPAKQFNLPALQQQVENAGIAQSTILDLRYIPNEAVASLFALAACVVLPYRSATQSGALQTAYTFGKPVVATNVGSLPEVVVDGKTGYLVPPANPTALFAAILKLLTNKEQAAQMGAAANQCSQTRFAWAPIARQILDVYTRTHRR